MKKNLKPLLTESETRKMLKMSGIAQHLIESRIEELYGSDCDDMQEMDGDVDADMELEEPEGGEFTGSPDDMSQLVADLADVLMSHTGVDIEVEGPEGMDDEMPDMDDEMDMDDEEMDMDDEEMDMDDEDELEESDDFEHPLNKPGRSGTKPKRKKPRPVRKPSAGAAKVVEELEEEMELEESDDFEHPLNKPGRSGTKPKRKKPRPVRKPSAGAAKVVEELDNLEEDDTLEEDTLEEEKDPNAFSMQKVSQAALQEMESRIVNKLTQKLLEAFEKKKSEK